MRKRLLVNDHPGEEAIYQVNTRDQVDAILRVDPGAHECGIEEYRAVARRMRRLDAQAAKEARDA